MKMNLDDLTLGQIKELKAACGVVKKKKVINDNSVRICVLQRGWVVVGRFSQWVGVALFLVGFGSLIWQRKQSNLSKSHSDSE